MKGLVSLAFATLLLAIPAAHSTTSPLPEHPIVIQVLTNKEAYEPGEPVEIHLVAMNKTEREITLNFPTGHQQDYCIDGEYLWSKGKSFTEALSSVTIPAGGKHVWPFVHTEEDYYLAPGMHTIVGTVVGYGISLPVPIVVREGKRLEVTVSTDKEVYGVGEKVPIRVTITNKTDAQVVLKFTSDREAGYIIDGVYSEYNGGGFLDIYTEIPLEPGESYFWEFVHDPADYPLLPGKHSIVGIVVGYGHSAPWVIYVQSGLEVTVETDKNEYVLDEDVQIVVTATNTSSETMKLEFRSSHQASYSIDGVYHWHEHQPGMPVVTYLELGPGESETWTFTHKAEQYRLLPGPHSVVGIIIGYAKSEPKKIFVGEAAVPIAISVATDKEEYELGEPVKIDVSATNTSDSPVTLHFPTLHQADYAIDGVYLWSKGKFFLPIGVSLTIPAGGQMTWHFVHTSRDYRLLPGEHSIVGIIVGYGKSEPVSILVKEAIPDEIVVRGLLLKDEPPRTDGGPYGGYPPYFLYTLDPEEVYCLFPMNGINLDQHVNKTVEVKGHYVYTLLPIPGIGLGVTSIRDLLEAEVHTDKAKYYPEENIEVTLLLKNMTEGPEAETLIISINQMEDVRAWVDDFRLYPELDSTVASLDTLDTFEIEPGDALHWTFVYRGEENPLPLGRHIVSGEVRRYARSGRLPIAIIEEPVQKIVARGIVDKLEDNIITSAEVAVPRYVLVDPVTSEKLYILRNPAIPFAHYVGQYVEVVGVLCEDISYRDVTLAADEVVPELFVLCIQRLLAVSVSTDKVFYDPTEEIAVYVTAKNCTPEEMTLTFASDDQAYYKIESNVATDSLARSLNTGSEVVIPPHGLHVWTFTHTWEAEVAPGAYTVSGGVYGYGQARPVSIVLKEDPPAIVTAEGVLERFWWYKWFEPTLETDTLLPEPWPWIYPCRYVLVDPEQGQILYFLSSHRVPLTWYIGMGVRVTGYLARDIVVTEPPTIELRSAGEGGESGEENPPFVPPMIWPPIENHLDVVSVLPLDGETPPDENGDGIPDVWEIVTGLRALGAGRHEDSDGDGVPNGKEYFFGTDPLDPASFPDVKAEVNPAGLAVLRWKAVLGKTYSVYCAEGLGPGPLQWRLLVRGIGGNGGDVEWTDDGAVDVTPSNDAGLKLRFYRVMVE